MDKENLKTWFKAGAIASEALEYGKTLLKPEANVLDFALKIEDFIAFGGFSCSLVKFLLLMMSIQF